MDAIFHVKWKRKTLKRDSRTCQVCGSQHELEIHHILSRSLYPELQAESSNLITLCHECHVYLHDVLIPDNPNHCNHLTVIKLFAHRGNRSRIYERKFMYKLLQRAKRGEFNEESD